MKQLLTAVALVAASVSVSAFAQTSQPAPIAGQDQSTSAAGQWMQPVQQKTRAQVYQELVQAQQDGQMRYLTRPEGVYSGS